jgi:hypothetical protein
MAARREAIEVNRHYLNELLDITSSWGAATCERAKIVNSIMAAGSPSGNQKTILVILSRALRFFEISRVVVLLDAFSISCRTSCT